MFQLHLFGTVFNFNYNKSENLSNKKNKHLSLAYFNLSSNVNQIYYRFASKYILSSYRKAVLVLIILPFLIKFCTTQNSK